MEPFVSRVLMSLAKTKLNINLTFVILSYQELNGQHQYQDDVKRTDAHFDFFCKKWKINCNISFLRYSLQPRYRKTRALFPK